MRHQFSTEQWVPYPVERVFLFFADPGNLLRLMPRWQCVGMENLQRVDPPPKPSGLCGTDACELAAGAGTRMTIRFRPIPLLPVRFAWDARITEFVWMDHFCDEQEKRGSFALWKHCHKVKEELREGRTGTLVRDRLSYELPFGLLGEMAHVLGVRMQIQSLFRTRQRRLLELLSAE